MLQKKNLVIMVLLILITSSLGIIFSNKNNNKKENSEVALLSEIENAVSWAYNKGLIPLYYADTDIGVTRDYTAFILEKYINYSNREKGLNSLSQNDNLNMYFNDLEYGSYYKSVNSITEYASRINQFDKATIRPIIGYGNGYFGPQDYITRGQFIIMLWKIAGEPNVSSDRDNVPFNDITKNNIELYNAIKWGYANDIVKGVNNSSFSPQNRILKRHLIMFLKRYDDNWNNTYIDGYLIVNKTYALPKSYVPNDPTYSCEGEGNDNCKGLNKNVYENFKIMKNAMKESNLNIYIQSGYRSYEYQDKNLYNGTYKNDANRDEKSARPGHSEHQTGLAFDVCSNDYPKACINSNFEGTLPAKWLKNHSYEYGFIIRYPKNKKEYTGYKYEPWHLRYVGKDLAEKLYNKGNYLTIEEYFGIDSTYSY